MLHLCYFGGNLAGSPRNVLLPAVSDGWLQKTGSQYIAPVACKLYQSFTFGTGLTNARLQYEPFREVGFPYLPVGLANYLNVIQSYFSDETFQRNVVINKSQSFGLQISSNTAASTAYSGVMTLWDGSVYKTRSPIYTLRATGGANTVANKWVDVKIAFDQKIPDGTYDVIGMAASTAAGTAIRVRFSNQTNLPGLPFGFNGAIFSPFKEMRFGRPGLLGRFTNYDIPIAQIIAQTAVPLSFELYLDVVKIS